MKSSLITLSHKNMAIDPHRRNLIAISAALSIFNLGQGDINKITTLFGAIELEKPVVLEYSAWLMFVYFLWQYWLHSKKNWYLFGRAWRQEIRKDPGFQKIAEISLKSSAKNLNVKDIENLVIKNQSTGNEGITVGGPIWRRTFEIMKPGKENKTIEQKQKTYLLDTISAKHIIKKAFFESDFSNNIMPYFFAIFAISTLFF